MKTGLFFGTYNPVHVGHMVIANYMVEFTDLEEIRIVVTPQNPFKEDQSIIADFHRLEMVKLAINEDFRLKVSDVEFSLPQPNFTFYTLRHMRETSTDNEFVVVMGADNLNHFHKWKNYEEILEHHDIYVYPRLGEIVDAPLLNHPKVSLHEAPIMQISSSSIRRSIAEKRDVRHYLPGGVFLYITAQGFYEKV